VKNPEVKLTIESVGGGTGFNGTVDLRLARKVCDHMISLIEEDIRVSEELRRTHEQPPFPNTRAFPQRIEDAAATDSCVLP
jgi:hypothetical protein